LEVLHINLLYDDVFLIIINPFIRDTHGLLEYLSAGRPVRSVTLYLDYALWGYNSRGYHLTNFILHLACVLVWFRFLEGRFAGRWAAWGAALLFAVHPAGSEALALVSHRKEMLAFLFLVCALWSYVVASGTAEALKDGEWKKVRWRPYALSWLFFFLGLGSKQVVVILPFLAFVADYLLVEQSGAEVLRRRWAWYLPYFVPPVLMATLFVGDWRVFGYLPPSDIFGEFHWRVLAISGWSVSAYSKIMAWPIYLSADHQFRTPQWWSVAFGVFLWFAMLWAGLRLRSKNKAAAFGLVWIPLNLLTVLNLIPANQPLAERYLYIPLAGFCFFIISVIEHVTSRESKLWGVIRWVGLTTLAIASLKISYRYLYEGKLELSLITVLFWITVIALLGAALIAARKGREDVSFWRAAFFFTVAFTATTWIITPLMTRSFQGEWKKSLIFTPEKRQTFNQKLIRKGHVGRRMNFGRRSKIVIRLGVGLLACALLGMVSAGFVSCPWSAGNRSRRDWMAVVILTTALLGTMNSHRLKQWKNSRSIWNATLRTDPTSQRANVNLGVYWMKHNQPERAEWHYARATAINPRNSTVWHNLGLIYLQRNDYKLAEDAFLKVAALDPRNVAAHLNLGNIYLVQGRKKEAIEKYRKVIKIEPRNARAYYNMAVIMENMGDDESAYDYCREALAIVSDFKKAQKMCGSKGRLRPQPIP